VESWAASPQHRPWPLPGWLTSSGGRLGDILVVAVVGAAQIAVPVLAGPPAAGQRHLDALGIALLAVSALALAARRKRPVAVLVVTVVAVALYYLLGFPHGVSFLSLYVAFFTAVVRAGFRALVDAEDDIEVVGEASDGEEAVRLTRRHRPDIVLMDIRMPGVDGLEASKRILGDPEYAGVRIVILTTFESDEYIFEALRLGASGFLVKDTEPADLIKAIRVVAGGSRCCPRGDPAADRRVLQAGQGAARAAGHRRAHRARARGHGPGRAGAVQ
jgi:DNA-binding NarL/FixJ family response regulator